MYHVREEEEVFNGDSKIALGGWVLERRNDGIFCADPFMFKMVFDIILGCGES